MRFEVNSKKGIINDIGDLSSSLILKYQYIDFDIGKKSANDISKSPLISVGKHTLPVTSSAQRHSPESI